VCQAQKRTHKWETVHWCASQVSDGKSQKRPRWFAYGDCCHGKVDGSASDRRVQSSSDGWRCVCTAFFVDVFGGGRLPVKYIKT
jgi:hypothetical protein